MSENSLKKIGVKFAESKQSRSQEAVKNLIEAAERIVESGDSSNLNARQLSKVSGYSLGSLVQRLGKVENVFLHTIAYGREKHIKACCAQAETFDVNKTATEFAEYMVNLSIDTINNIVGPSIVRYYESRALGRVPTILKVSTSNKTGTFREFSLYEAKYVARAIFLFIERPFAENDPLAGSDDHRRMASRQVASLLSVDK